MSETYFEVLPIEILNLIFLQIEDGWFSFDHLLRTNISPVVSVLRTEIFWKTRINMLFPKGGIKYVNPYLTSFKNLDDDIIIMKYSVLFDLMLRINTKINNKLYKTDTTGKLWYLGKSTLETTLEFVNNYDCLRLDLLPYPERRQIVSIITTHKSDNIKIKLDIEGTPRHLTGCAVKLTIVGRRDHYTKYNISAEDTRNLLGHIISNGGNFKDNF
jgi:hypothetical protein